MKSLLITPKQVTQLYSIPTSTLYRWLDKGTFPNPIKVGPRKTLFKVSDIEAWLEDQAQKSEEK